MNFATLMIWLRWVLAIMAGVNTALALHFHSALLAGVAVWVGLTALILDGRSE